MLTRVFYLKLWTLPRVGFTGTDAVSSERPFFFFLKTQLQSAKVGWWAGQATGAVEGRFGYAYEVFIARSVGVNKFRLGWACGRVFRVEVLYWVDLWDNYSQVAFSPNSPQSKRSLPKEPTPCQTSELSCTVDRETLSLNTVILLSPYFSSCVPSFRR